MHALLSRRQLMQEAGTVIATMLVAPATLDAAATGGVLIVAADSPQARDIARELRAPPERIILLRGDPVRFWREQGERLSGPVLGVTRWSDFLLLRELAYEQRLRLRSETHHPIVGGALLVSFRLA
jgi:hypothetical protein